jgi:predicted ArsR family transcriptional regulator
MTQDQPNSQDKILYQIKRLGPQTAKALSQKLNVTTMGIRQHLSLLEGQELIQACDPLPQKRAGLSKPGS